MINGRTHGSLRLLGRASGPSTFGGVTTDDGTPHQAGVAIGTHHARGCAIRGALQAGVEIVRPQVRWRRLHSVHHSVHRSVRCLLPLQRLPLVLSLRLPPLSLPLFSIERL